MKLFYSQPSPYVRLVRVFAHYHQLIDELELINAKLGRNETELRKVNPLGKIPALIDRNERCLYDSRTILYYLDSIGSGDKLFATNAAQHISHQRDLAHLIGILELGVALVMDRRRNLHDMPDFMQERWMYGIRLALQELEFLYAKSLSPVLKLFTPVVVDWLQFRLPETMDLEQLPSLKASLTVLQTRMYLDSDPRI